jgi:site-specific DNA-methyltransferase (adenine-specific)
VDFLAMLYRVFEETYRVLEPGGRAAINVANLGRRPYVAFSDHVVEMCKEIGFLPRGEIIWVKGAGSSGNSAWGSWRKPTNPTLRDLHEYIIVMSKGRFDRAIKPPERERLGLPYRPTITGPDFMEATLSVWNIRPESAKRIGHPAPFPVEIPRRLIELYTFADDLVLDPFMGAGATAVAAVRTGRRYIGYDLDAGYLEIAQRRIDAELAPPEPEQETA